MSYVRFPAKNHPQQVKKRGADDGADDRATPPELFEEYDNLHHFTLDVAASDANHKTPAYYTRKEDGLLQPWTGQRVWCNPPYSGIEDWITKALAETGAGCPLVVMLLPANRCEQSWWQNWIEPLRDRSGSGVTTRFIRGRRRFGWPATHTTPEKGDRPPFGLVVVAFKNLLGDLV